MRLPDAELDSVLGVSRNLCCVSMLSLMKKVTPWKTKMNQGEGYVSTGVRFSKPASRAQGITNTKNILRYVQKAPDDIRWTIYRTEFDELIALKKDSAPGPDGFPYRAYRCAGGLGSQFLFNAYKFQLERGTVPEHFAESRTVFNLKTSDTDDLARIIRSPDALLPLTLCNCDCKLLTSAVC